MVEKAFKRYPDYQAEDVIFEYAMCMDCGMKMRNELSAESLANIENYFAQNVDFERRQELLMAKQDLNTEDWLKHCLVKGTPTEALNEYQIFGHFDGTQMVYSVFPYMIGGEALDELGALLSDKTLDELDDFMGNNFGLPPELKELIPTRRLVLI